MSKTTNIISEQKVMVVPPTRNGRRNDCAGGGGVDGERAISALVPLRIFAHGLRVVKSSGEMMAAKASEMLVMLAIVPLWW